MSLNPVNDALEARKKQEAIELCGKNRGPHDYIPIEWKFDNETSVERVTRFLCRVCFCNVSTKTFLLNYPEVSYDE